MKTIKDVQEFLKIGRNDLLSILNKASFNGAIKLSINDSSSKEEIFIVRSLFNWEKARDILCAKFNLTKEISKNILMAAIYCDDTCEGCLKNDGSGCDAIATFHEYIE